MEIHWEQALQVSEKQQKISKERRKELIKEIAESDFSMFDATDINYFAGALDIDSNLVRAIHLRANPHLTNFDLIHTFENDDTDSVIDFY